MKKFRFGDFYVKKDGNPRVWVFIPFVNICISFAIIVSIGIALLPFALYMNTNTYFNPGEEK